MSDARSTVSAILKKVDQLIKAGDIDESIRQVIRAREIDPKHVYIHAYEERLAYLKEQHQKNVAEEQTRKSAEEAARRRAEELQMRHEEERARLAEQAVEVVAEEPPPARLEEPLPVQPEEPPPVQSAPSKGIYRDTPTVEGSRTIMVIDDDAPLLEMLTQALRLSGYKTKGFTRSDDAFALLREWTPDLILCDVNLETSTMGGFTFYEKIQAIDRLQDVPFVFLTGLNDDVLMRNAKEMGVDDYLTKPVSIENLLATVKGKLRRFSAFKKPGK